MWRGAAQWLGWMLESSSRKHQKRVENREGQEASRSNVAVSSTTQHPGPASGHFRDHTTLGTHGGTHGRTAPAVDGADDAKHQFLYHLKG